MTIGQHFTGGTAPAPRSGRPQVAVVGAGVAGLTSAYLLQRRHDVTLYEAQDRLGGHAHTHDIVSGDGRVPALDSGFLVHNTRTYPRTPPARLCCTPTPLCCPGPRRARASWNYLLRDCAATAVSVHVSYHLNRLQGLAEATDYLVTLNALDRVGPQRVLRRMTYGHPVYDERSVAAQLDRTGVGQATSVLEIGTGWGELAIRAAARGARVTTVTISPSQWRTARRRAETAGVTDRVDVQLRDYREAAGSYDAVLSVEMIEAVGERYWPAYFTAIDRLLAPGGRAGLQAITMPHDRMLATRGGRTWIRKYIFPGGQIPSLQASTPACA